MAITNVQTAYYDRFARGFAGDILNPASLDGNACFSAPVASGEQVFVGRGLVSTPLVDGQNVANGIAIATPTAVSTADDFVGILMTDKGALTDGLGNDYIPEKRMGTYARADRSAIIYVKVKSGVTISAGDDVWMAVAAVNTANIAVGEFTNSADAGAGTGMVQLPYKFYKGNEVGEVALIDLTKV